MIPNAFNTPRLCMLTGEIRPLPKHPNVNQFTKPTTAFKKSGIVIPKLADYDNRRTIRKAAI